MPVPKKGLKDSELKKSVLSDIHKEIRRETNPSLSRIFIIEKVLFSGILVVVIASLLVFLPYFPYALEGGKSVKINSPLGDGSVLPPADNNPLLDILPKPDLQLNVKSHDLVSGLNCQYNSALTSTLCEISTVYPNHFIEVTLLIENKGFAAGEIQATDFTFIDTGNGEYSSLKADTKGYLGSDTEIIAANAEKQIKVVFKVDQGITEGTVQYRGNELYEIKTPGALGLVSLDSYEVKFGQKVTATFIPAENTTVYTKGNCGNPWTLSKRGSAQKWEPFLNWQYNIHECTLVCENNFVSDSGGCAGICPEVDQCLMVDSAGEAVTTYWDLKTYTSKTGVCGDLEGKFVFIEPASPKQFKKDQYRFEFTYYEESDCVNPRVAKTIFNVE